MMTAKPMASNTDPGQRHSPRTFVDEIFILRVIYTMNNVATTIVVASHIVETIPIGVLVVLRTSALSGPKASSTSVGLNPNGQESGTMAKPLVVLMPAAQVSRAACVSA